MELDDLIITPGNLKSLWLGDRALELVRVTPQEPKRSGTFAALEALTLSAFSREPVTAPTDPATAETEAW